ncbi:Ras-related protein Rab-30 [Tritrichomonas foetus]|uniref:Ras-related protein Rab-30 n=1 Tax=Tritrichomonas foetus TaxID=1144522 RepID=A0A1J4KHV5_9EUKA|nr:Ras-related protein Rab-30 [Tritrichomonas foetus]|eukprot:OHT09238.1 Ras-related protein Rab-30 [Tritrichomonas foetus]
MNINKKHLIEKSKIINFLNIRVSPSHFYFFMSTNTYKLAIIGDTFVGKTSILRYLKEKSFNPLESPTISGSYSKTVIQTEKGPVELEIWDTAGTERFSSLIPMYSRSADSLKVVCALDSDESLKKGSQYMMQALEQTEEKPVMILLSNKYDLNPSTDLSQYQEFAEEHEMMYLPTSAKTGENILKAFNLIATELITNRKKMDDDPQEIHLMSVIDETKRRMCC